eukprot:2480049-Rhodomonas_salina.1
MGIEAAPPLRGEGRNNLRRLQCGIRVTVTPRQLFWTEFLCSKRVTWVEQGLSSYDGAHARYSDDDARYGDAEGAHDDATDTEDARYINDAARYCQLRENLKFWLISARA